MNEEGNIMSPFGCFKPASPLSPVIATSHVTTTTTLCTTMATTAVVASKCSVRTAVCVCCPLSGNITTCPAFSQPTPAVPQPTSATRAATTTTTCCITMVSTAAVTPVMTAVHVPALAFSGSFPILAHGLTSCVMGGVRHHPAKTKVIKLVSELECALQDKDCTMAALNLQHKQDLMAMQSKYDALYFHCTAMAKDLRRKETMLDYLKEADQTQKTLCAAQQQLARSTKALAKNHRTKFITGQTHLVYRSTDDSPGVLQEKHLAAERIRAEQAKQERADLTKLSNVVDRLAAKYDRYNMISTTNIHNTRCAPDGLPCTVPREMMGIWLYADNMEPTLEEIAVYEFHLQKEVRGPPIYSPNLPRPTVNWNALNKHKRKNLPDPEIFPIQSVPADPNFYLDGTKYKPVDQHNNGKDPMTTARIVFGKECGCAACVAPFGHKYGLLTDMGVISMPEASVHGYRWDEITASWVIATGG